MEMLAQLVLMEYRGSVFFPHASATSSSLMCYILLRLRGIALRAVSCLPDTQENVSGRRTPSAPRAITPSILDPGQSSATPDLCAPIWHWSARNRIATLELRAYISR